jgi:ribosomal-protein-alanine N-acetyltransferase
MEVSFIRGRASASLAFKRHRQDRVPALFKLTNRVGRGEVCSIARAYWGRGLATEAARAAVDAVFSAYTDLDGMRAMADAGHVASLRVTEKLGMVREGVLRQNRLVRGEFINEVWCSVLRTEWAA